MRRQWVPVLSVLALVVLTTPSSGVAPPTANTTNDTSLGTSISSFVQVSAVEAEAEVDREMFAAALANASTDAARRRLLEHRTATLSRRLESVRRTVATADRDDSRQRVVERTVANARVDALERCVVDIDTLTTRETVTLPGLDELRRNVGALREPAIPAALDIDAEAELDPSSQSGRGEAPAAGDGDGSSSPDDSVPDSTGSGVSVVVDGGVDGPSVENVSNATDTTPSTIRPFGVDSSVSNDPFSPSSRAVSVLPVYH